MDFGVTGNFGGRYLAEQYRKNAAAGTGSGVSFAELAAATVSYTHLTLPTIGG